MKRRSKSLWIVAALIALAVMLAGNGTATAGIAVTMAQSTPVGDPLFEYYLQITVDGTTTPITTGDYLEVSGFTFLTSFSGAATANDWSSSDLNTNPSDGSVIFTYTGTSSIDSKLVYPTGDFRVGPTSDISTPPTPILIYTAFTSTGTVIDSGSIQVNFVVPEPSSLLLLSVGLGTLTMILLRQGRRFSGLKASASI